MEALSTLVIAAQDGDLEAFGTIIERFRDMAYASAYAMVADVQLAEDVTQEAFIEAYLNLPKLREPAAFPGWFRRIVFKQGDRVTRTRQFVTTPLETAFDISADDSDPARMIEAKEMHESVRHAIETLSEHERMAIILFYSTGYALKEIAAFLDVPVTTIKKRLYDGRQHLKDELLDKAHSSLCQRWPSSIENFSHKVQLLIAARLGNLANVKALLDHEPMLINMKAKHREHLVYTHTIQLLPEHTALHEAANNGHAALVDLLLDYGANLDARTSSGMTPLHGAVLYNRKNVVELLLARGANVNATCNNGHTPLHWATMRGHYNTALLLLEHGAAVNATSVHGRTALHWAALKGHRDVVQVLLEKGADRNVQDELGRAPLAWAASRGHLQVVVLLRQGRAIVEFTNNQKEYNDERSDNDYSGWHTCFRAGA